MAVKPHASPVYHAIKYLTGELDRSYLTTLRQRGGLQAYPSRTKDPDVADFSTGSVGLGAVAPLFSALTRRYVDSHFGGLPPARFIALVGDAELDEGNVWEAIADPATQGLGNFTMVVDLNRQSLDRVIPDIAAIRLKRFFADAGWHVAEAKYGRRLSAAFAEPRRRRARGAHRRDAERGVPAAVRARGRPTLDASSSPAPTRSVRDLADGLADDELQRLVTDLGGHDLGSADRHLPGMRRRNRPAVGGVRLHDQGPRTADRRRPDEPRSAAEPRTDRRPPDAGRPRRRHRVGPLRSRHRTPAGCVDTVGGDINNEPTPPRPALPIPAAARPPVTNGSTSTQEAFGRVLASLADVEGVGERIVTTAPDVSISTNLGGFINKRGVYSPTDRDDHGGADRLLKWAPAPSGQHIELGISEMNLFMLLGQLGLSHDHHGQHLLPVGTVYDPFVLRGLDAFIYGLYNDARFVVAGTPAGVTLAPGGRRPPVDDHRLGRRGTPEPHLQSNRPSPPRSTGCCAMHSTSSRSPNGTSSYLRLSTRPIDQAPFAAALERLGEDELRRQVLAGGYRLLEPDPDDRHGDGRDRPGGHDRDAPA